MMSVPRATPRGSKSDAARGWPSIAGNANALDDSLSWISSIPRALALVGRSARGKVAGPDGTFAERAHDRLERPPLFPRDCPQRDPRAGVAPAGHQRHDRGPPAGGPRGAGAGSAVR